jgi:organic hydroperoxide reductase OsmC/OhrA
MPEQMSFTIYLEQEQDYRFRVDFGGLDVPSLLVDEPEPLGEGKGPNAARLLAAAVAHCLSASLLFCMRKFKQNPGKLRTDVTATLVRNERGRLRIGRIDAAIRLGDAVERIAHFDRCLEQFEDFCVVTGSVRQGIPVGVRVMNGEGREVYAAEA